MVKIIVTPDHHLDLMIPPEKLTVDKELMMQILTDFTWGSVYSNDAE